MIIIEKTKSKELENMRNGIITKEIKENLPQKILNEIRTLELQKESYKTLGLPDNSNKKIKELKQRSLSLPVESIFKSMNMRKSRKNIITARINELELFKQNKANKSIHKSINNEITKLKQEKAQIIAKSDTYFYNSANSLQKNIDKLILKQINEKNNIIQKEIGKKIEEIENKLIPMLNPNIQQIIDSFYFKQPSTNIFLIEDMELEKHLSVLTLKEILLIFNKVYWNKINKKYYTFIGPNEIKYWGRHKDDIKNLRIDIDELKVIKTEINTEDTRLIILIDILISRKTDILHSTIGHKDLVKESFNTLVDKIKSYNYKNNNKNNVIKIFEKYNQLFSHIYSKIKNHHHNPNIYSEYDFLYGINKESIIEEQTGDTKILTLKSAVFMFLGCFPEYILPIIAMSATGPMSGASGVAVLGLLLSKYIMNSFRLLKRRFSKKITYCTKYMPFEGFSCYNSSVIASYFKIFVYEKDDNVDDKINRYLNDTIFNNDYDEDENFYNRTCLLVQYCTGYNTEIDNKIKKDDAKAVSKVSPELIKALDDIKHVGVQRNINSKSNEGNNGSGIQIGIGHNGGANLNYLENEIKEKRRYKRSSDILLSGYNQNVPFRFNYKINNELLLISGDITILSLYNNVIDIINSYSSFMTSSFMKPFMVKIPFFRDDYLMDLLSATYTTITKIASFNALEELIVNFITEYLQSFQKLFALSKDNIKLLIKEQNVHYHGLHLKDLFKVNLSYYGVKDRYRHHAIRAGWENEGKYEFGIKKNVRSGEEYIYSDDIQLRDKIIYYTLLMKYSYLAIDHIIKKFQINVVKFEDNEDIFNNYNKYKDRANDYMSKWTISKMTFTSYPSYENTNNQIVQENNIVVSSPVLQSPPVKPPKPPKFGLIGQTSQTTDVLPSPSAINTGQQNHNTGVSGQLSHTNTVATGRPPPPPRISAINTQPPPRINAINPPPPPPRISAINTQPSPNNSHLQQISTGVSSQLSQQNNTRVNLSNTKTQWIENPKKKGEYIKNPKYIKK